MLGLGVLRRQRNTVVAALVLSLAGGGCGDLGTSENPRSTESTIVDAPSEDFVVVAEVDAASVSDAPLVRLNAVNYGVLDDATDASTKLLDTIFFECDSACQMALASVVFAVPDETIKSQPQGVFDKTARIYFTRVEPGGIAPIEAGTRAGRPTPDQESSESGLATSEQTPDALALATVDGNVTFSATLHWERVIDFIETQEIEPTRIVWR